MDFLKRICCIKAHKKANMEAKLVENIDFYRDELGRMVFTETYHLKRGYCCKNDCKHCPFKHTDTKNTALKED